MTVPVEHSAGLILEVFVFSLPSWQNRADFIFRTLFFQTCREPEHGKNHRSFFCPDRNSSAFDCKAAGYFNFHRNCINFISLLFIAGLSYKIVLTVLGICIPTGLIGITVILRMAQSSGDYRFGRIMAWLYPQDPRWSDIAAQQQNSIMAIGSGQLWGKGLNNSAATSMKNANYIIEPQTDFIFAVAGEELGFIGTMVIVLLLLFIVIECILIARKAKDLAGRLICCGMAALIGFQSIFNIFVATGLMPNTGIPLPFVSYGLTSLLSLYLGMGFVLNVGLQPKKY